MSLRELFLGCAALVAAFSLSGCPTEPIAVTGGQIDGLAAGTNGDVEVFKGIPFAAPPVGNLRWKAPQPVAPWDGVRHCWNFGPAAVQSSHGNLGNQLLLSSGISEDCLYLNVWRPSHAAGAPLPVMVFIYGGGFTFGAASTFVYDGTKLAQHGVILVNFNYRLGAFGFMGHPALSAENEHDASGNYGLLDQIAALQWVHDNIAAFGGDPENVTVFGESAGSISISCLLASPLAAGLFQRAIMESGIAPRLRHLHEESKPGVLSVEEDGVSVAQNLNVIGVNPGAAAALRAQSADAVFKAAGSRNSLDPNPLFPCVDGWVLPDQPLALIQQGKYNHVPIIVGTNADEGTFFVLADSSILSPMSYPDLASAIFGDFAPEVLAFYPTPVGDRDPTIAQIITGYGFLAPSRMMVRAVSADLPEVYYYHFSRQPTGLIGDLFGSYHIAEVPYVFGNTIGLENLNADDQTLADTMRAYWLSFAKTGNPNGAGRPAWPQYNADDEQNIEFATPISLTSHLETDVCDLFTMFVQQEIAPDMPLN